MNTSSHVNHILPLAVRGQPPFWALAQGFDQTLTVMIAGMATWATCMLALSLVL
jgi:hypothetical protein